MFRVPSAARFVAQTPVLNAMVAVQVKCSDMPLSNQCTGCCDMLWHFLYIPCYICFYCVYGDG